MLQLNQKSIFRIWSEQLFVVLASNQHRHTSLAFQRLPSRIIWQRRLCTSISLGPEPPPINGGVELDFSPHTWKRYTALRC